MTIEFGDKVFVSARLRRRCGEYETDTTKTWVRELKLRGMGSVFLGWRTLSNGARSYHQDEGYSYSVKERFRAALVCDGPRTNPYYAMPEDLEAAE